MSDNTPTLRLPTAPPSEPPSTPPPAPPGRPSRGPLIAFVLLSVLVVAAAGVLVYVLIGRAAANPQATSTPPSTASAAQSQPPAQPGTFTVFTVPPNQVCRGHGKDRQAVGAQVTWATTNATQVWVAEGTADAASAGSEQVPLSGNQDAFPAPLPVDCNSTSSTFTMTLVGADGAHVSRTWTVLVAGRHG